MTCNMQPVKHTWSPDSPSHFWDISGRFWSFQSTEKLTLLSNSFILFFPCVHVVSISPNDSSFFLPLSFGQRRSLILFLSLSIYHQLSAYLSKLGMHYLCASKLSMLWHWILSSKRAIWWLHADVSWCLDQGWNSMDWQAYPTRSLCPFPYAWLHSGWKDTLALFLQVLMFVSSV